jgi:uncharacterized protein YxjI
MKNYYVKQKVFSLLDQYKIYDRNQNALFQCKKRAFSFSGKLDFVDAKTDQTIYLMKRRLFTFLPVFEIYSDDVLVATIYKRFSLFKGKVDIVSTLGNFSVEGNYTNHQFNIHRNNMIVASITKKWLSWGDSYEISVEEDENQELMVALVIMIDRLFHSKSSARRR